MLTDTPDVVEIQVNSPVVPPDHSAIFIDVVLEKPVPRLVCRQKVSGTSSSSPPSVDRVG